jgi:hypothetical protein
VQDVETPGAIADAWHHYLMQRGIGDGSTEDVRELQRAFLSGARASYGVLYVLFHLAEGMDEISQAFETLGEELGLDDDEGARE